MTSSAGLQANTRRFELYVHISLYFLLACEPLVVLGATAGAVVPSVLALAHAVANAFVCRWLLASARTGAFRLSWRLVLCGLGWLVLSLATVLVTISRIADVSAVGIVLTVTVGTSVGSLAPAFRPRWLPVLAAAGAVVAGLAAVAWGFDAATAAGLAVGMLITLMLLTFSFWLSRWMLNVVWELDSARRRAAELAIAEERLRIARDLHDLYGRTLAIVAVKSELAAELIRRGRAETAADEIAAVRVIADESGREMRQLVQGYREADLSAELSGARALLDSAGIRCVVDGSAPGLATEIASALGWTLREAVTNVIRHSDAKECFIRVEAGPEFRLSVTNDGAHGAGGSGAGGSGAGGPGTGGPGTGGPGTGGSGTGGSGTGGPVAGRGRGDREAGGSGLIGIMPQAACQAHPRSL